MTDIEAVKVRLQDYVSDEAEWDRGYRAGKTKARQEVIILAGVLCIIAALFV